MGKQPLLERYRESSKRGSDRPSGEALQQNSCINTHHKHKHVGASINGAVCPPLCSETHGRDLHGPPAYEYKLLRSSYRLMTWHIIALIGEDRGPIVNG